MITKTQATQDLASSICLIKLCRTKGALVFASASLPGHGSVLPSPADSGVQPCHYNILNFLIDCLFFTQTAKFKKEFIGQY
jgi:hypothetical protein